MPHTQAHTKQSDDGGPAAGVVKKSHHTSFARKAAARVGGHHGKKAVYFQKCRIMPTRSGVREMGVVPDIPRSRRSRCRIVRLAMTRHAKDLQSGDGDDRVVHFAPRPEEDISEENEFKDDARSPKWSDEELASFVRQVYQQAPHIEGIVARVRDSQENDPHDAVIVRVSCSQGKNRSAMLTHCIAAVLRKRGVLSVEEVHNEVPQPQRPHILKYTNAFVTAPFGAEEAAMAEVASELVPYEG